MFGPNEIKTAIIMCKRASCSGEESLAVAQSILGLEELYKAATAEPAKKGPAPKAGKKKPRGQPK